MKLNIYLHKEKSALDTACVKIGKNEIAPNKDSMGQDRSKDRIGVNPFPTYAAAGFDHPVSQ